MPTFHLTSPDGKTYDIEGPPGSTLEEAVEKAKKMDAGTFVASGDRPVLPRQRPDWVEKLVTDVFVDPLVAGATATKEAMTGQLGQPGTREFTERAIPGAAKAAQLGVVGAPSAEAMGARTLARMAQKQAVEAAQLPADAIKAGAQTAFKAVEDARLIASEKSINDFVSATRAGLDQKLMVEGSAQRTFLGVKQLEQSKGDIAQILSVYTRLGEIKPDEGADFAAAQEVRARINDYLAGLKQSDVISGDPKFTKDMLDKARVDWRAFMKLDQIDTALRVGQHRAAVAGTGANTQNAMRARIREILDSEAQSRGYTAQEKQQMEDIVMGTWISNQALKLGKFAPSGPVSAISTLMAAFGAGSHTGSVEYGAIAGAAVAIPSTIAMYLGTYLTKRQIAALQETIRAASAANQAAVRRAMAQPPPPTAAAARRVIPGAGPFAMPALSSALTGGTPATDALDQPGPAIPDSPPFQPTGTLGIRG